MKELSIEEKAKAYDKALERAKELIAKGYDVLMPELFPELKESEDEKTRKEIVGYLKRNLRLEWAAWLERQGEKKPIEEVNGEDYGIDGLWHAQRILENTLGSVDGYQTDDGILDHKAAITAVKKLYKQKHSLSEEDEHRIKLLEALCEDKLCESVPNSTMYEEMKITIDWLKSLRPQPKQKWTEEDKEMFKSLKTLLNNTSCYSCTEGVDKILAWLKSLKQKYTWKPSDKQMEALFVLLPTVCNSNPAFSLYNDLKKLKEE